jgi:dienelactone hydrolase
VRSAAIVLFFATSLAAAAATPTVVTFPSRDIDPATGAPVALQGLLFLPTLPVGGRVPAVVALHGCGGMYSTLKAKRNALSMRHQAMADLLVAEGYAVLFPDSFRARGREEICRVPLSERTITPALRALDAQGALAFLQQRGDVVPDRIAVLGWSHGGSTTLAAIDGRNADVAVHAAARPPYFRAAIAYYPGCRTARPGRSGYTPVAPLLMLIGGSDDWTAPGPCIALGARLRDVGAPATLVLYAGVFHGFDGPTGDWRRLDVPGGVAPGKGVTVASDPAARDDSYARVKAFLREELGPDRTADHIGSMRWISD